MDQLTITLDAQDHLMGEDETTVCGIAVPHGTSRLEDTDPCPECFPDAAKPKRKKAKADGDAA